MVFIRSAPIYIRNVKDNISYLVVSELMSMSDKQQLPYIVTLSNMESKLVGCGAIEACVGVILSLVSALLHPYEHTYSCSCVLCIHHTVLHYSFHV